MDFIYKINIKTFFYYGGIMIIAKPEWFERRKYGGWGVGIKTWQGAVYLLLLFLSLVVMIIISYLFLKSIIAMFVFIGLWLLFLFIDLGPITWKLKRDERETMHEAIAERNAAWGMMFVLVIGVLIEMIYNIIINRTIYVNPFIVIALIVGIIIKSITNYKLEKTN